jgi:ribonuclease G
MAGRVRRHEGTEPLLVEHGAEKAIRSTLERRAPLPGGGYLIIDDTEAMTVIDVNSGRNVGKGGNRLEDTVTKTNLEAATEVARQLRLRDIGGIIVVDFIDMSDEKNRRAVKQALESALEGDRSRTFVAEISALGLVEMTRQNISDGPREVMTEPIPDGMSAGVVLSEETIAIETCRAVMYAAQASPDDTVVVKVEPRAAELLNDDGGARLQIVQEVTGKKITVEAERGLAFREARVRAAGASGRSKVA